MRFKKNISIVLLRTTTWKLSFKPFGYHKLLLPVFGYLLSGSLNGLIAGLIIGLIMDCEIIQKQKPKKQTDNRISYLMLGAYILQVGELSGRLTQDTLHKRLVIKFGEVYATKRFAFFQELLRQRIQVEAICDQIKMYASDKEKQDIILFLFTISFHPTYGKEKVNPAINYIGSRIDLPYEEIKNIYNSFKFQNQNTYQHQPTPNKQPTSIYTTFNLNEMCTEKQLKTAFHHLAKKYHPDSNPNVSGSDKLILQEKLRKIIEAYEEIKLQRGWK